MGLFVSHGIYDGSEKQYNWIKASLADSLGINLWEMEGYGGTQSWSGFNDQDPLMVLFLDFSNNQTIHPEEAALLKERLQYMIDNNLIDSAIEHAVTKMVRGLESAYLYDEPVTFYETIS